MRGWRGSVDAAKLVKLASLERRVAGRLRRREGEICKDDWK